MKPVAKFIWRFRFIFIALSVIAILVRLFFVRPSDKGLKPGEVSLDDSYGLTVGSSWYENDDFVLKSELFQDALEKIKIHDGYKFCDAFVHYYIANDIRNSKFYTMKTKDDILVAYDPASDPEGYANDINSSRISTVYEPASDFDKYVSEIGLEYSTAGSDALSKMSFDEYAETGELSIRISLSSKGPEDRLMANEKMIEQTISGFESVYVDEGKGFASLTAYKALGEPLYYYPQDKADCFNLDKEPYTYITFRLFSNHLSLDELIAVIN